MIDYATFILSYKRAGRIKTLKSLKKQGYTGKTYIIVGNDDPTISEYEERYKDQVIVFDKYKYMDIVDTVDNCRNTGCVVYARHAVFDIAKEMGMQYFVMLDDDYSIFSTRQWNGKSLKEIRLADLDTCFEATIEWLAETDADCIAWAQNGDFIGGVNGTAGKKAILRKVMNTFFCRADRPLNFIGSTNEDTNYYVTANMQGRKIFTYTGAGIGQEDTQQAEGGLTDIYKRDGTYVKSFYSVICQPSCVKIGRMGDGHERTHHNVSWDNCAPAIISEKWKKEEKR